jgi:uncharacterized protein (TIGR00297 family)
MVERALWGALVAAIVTAIARRYGKLSESGQWAAFACGIGAAAAGWAWAALLITYFGAAVGVTTLGAKTKAARTISTLPQVAARDAAQVMANGGVFTLLALAAGPRPLSTAGLAAIGALAAASADSWATEIGTLWGGTPRSILSGAPMDTGLSGGVTLVGTLGAAAGALVVVLSAVSLHELPDARRLVLVACGAALVGTLADSVIGASVQARRWCERCRQWTERRVHTCGYRTVHARGLRWATNDVVNVAGTLTGAACAVLLNRLQG